MKVLRILTKTYLKCFLLTDINTLPVLDCLRIFICCRWVPEKPPPESSREQDVQLSEVSSGARSETSKRPKIRDFTLEILFQEHSGGLASKLFSTAVISGSKSLPNLVAGDKSCSKYPE